MTQVDNLTNFADQQTVLILEDGSTAAIDLTYNASAERWTMNVTYGAHIINGIGLCDSPNIIRQWKNVLPFGLAFVTSDQTDPFDINDFATERVKMFLLNASDVLQIETDVFTAP
jgi:hypothetical protein